MSLWFPCCIEQVEPPPCGCMNISTADCSGTAPSMYRLAMPGLGNSTCGSCGLWSGSFKLCWDAANSRWDSVTDTTTACGHSKGDPLYRLAKVGTNYDLVALGLGYTWRLAAASWSCGGDNTLSLVYPASSNCSGVPATVVLKSCLTTNACGFCVDSTMPYNTSVTFANFGAAGLCDCSAMNTTFALTAYSACIWTAAGTFSCPTAPLEIYSYSIQARLIYNSAYQTLLRVTLSVGASAVCDSTWVFTVLLTNPVDCEGTHSVPLTAVYWPDICMLCSNYNSVTCQFN